MNRREFLKKALYTGAGVAAVAASPGFFGMIEYLDLPGPCGKIQIGRTKNSIAAVVGGLVGQKLYGHSQIDLEIQKQFFQDARVTGTTTPNSVDTYVDLALTSAHFKAQKNAEGYLEGEVEKSEINWKVKQTSDDSYDIVRWGPKFNGSVQLKVADGKITGTYTRSGPQFDWSINGNYDADGNVKIEIDGHLNLGITLDGKISQKEI